MVACQIYPGLEVTCGTGQLCLRKLAGSISMILRIMESVEMCWVVR